MSGSCIFKEFSNVVKTLSAKPAIFFTRDKKNQSLSYADLYNQAVKLGNLLSSQGVIPQDRVAILLGNEPAWPASFMALQYIGAVAVPIDCWLDTESICALLLHSEVKGILCSKDIYLRHKNYLEKIKGLKINLVDSSQFQEQIASSSSELFGEVGPQDENKPAAIFYTSGTISSPKAVMLSQKNLLSNVNSIKELKLIKEEDVFISILPLHHAYSFMVICLLPLLRGVGISYPPGFTSEELLGCIRNTNVSILVGVPQFFALIHRNIKDRLRKLPFATRPVFDLFIRLLWLIRKSFGINLSKYVLFGLHQPFGKNFRFMISGGAKIDDKAIRDFFKWGFLILEGYGLTEASPVVALNTPKALKIGSVGKPLPNVEVEIMSANLRGIGEVSMRGPNLMLGYLNLSQEAQIVTKDGWLLTGDLGYLDRRGYLYITSRKDELIVLSSGQKVNPEEIEKHYGGSPYIKEICVFASGKTGILEGTNQLAAIVVPNEEYFRKRRVINITEKIRWELDNRTHHLRDFKRIKGFAISKDALPRTMFGKIMRRRINDEYFERLLAFGRKDDDLSSEDSVILSIETYKNLFSYLSERLQKKVKLDDHLELDLGLDSLNRVELLLELQKFFSIEVPDSLALELFYCSTIRDLVHKINPYLSENARSASIERIQWSDILNQKPPVETLKEIRLKPSFMDKVLAFIFLGFLQILFRVFYLFNIKHKENLPRKGPYIIYANHNSYLDGFFVLACLPMKTALNTYFVGFREYLLNPLIKNFLKTARLIPIDPVLNLVETLQVCSFLLKESKIICYFPEGGRSSLGKVAEFKKGIGILAKELNIPLVPIYIDGAFKAWSRYDRYPKLAKINIIIGNKIEYADVVSKAKLKPDDYESVAMILRDELMRLKK